MTIFFVCIDSTYSHETHVCLSRLRLPQTAITQIFA